MPDLGDLTREIAFRWRSLARASAPAWKRVAGTWDAVEGRLDPKGRRRLRRLRSRHGETMDRWPRLLTAVEMHEAAYVLDSLEAIGCAPTGTSSPSLDVGSKNGSNLPAFAAFRPGPWDLVEIDAHRRYLTLATRRAHGERVARAYPGCRFVSGDVAALQGPYDLVTWILPFVDPGPHAAWGLPARLFDPARLLSRVTDLVEPGGTLVVVNQGEVERDLQGELFAAGGIGAASLGPIRTELSPFRRTRYAWRWDRPITGVHST